MAKTIPQLGISPASSADLLWLEVAREITAGNWNGISERIRVSTLATLLADAGTAINLNLIQQLTPTGAAYSPTRTYTLYDYLDVPYQGGHYAYIGDVPGAGNAPPDPAHWVLISTDGGNGVSAIATIGGTPSVTPAVGSTASYTVDSSAGHGVNQYAAIVGISGVFFVTAIASSTQITLRNESAPVGAAVAVGAKIITAGKPGLTGPAGATGATGAKGDKGDKGDPGSGGGASGLQYTYQTTAGTGIISAADLTTATTLTLGTPDGQGKVVSDVLGRLKAGAIIEVAASAANRVRYAVTSDHANGSVGVAVAAVYGAIASGDTVYLAIVSPAPSVTTGGGSGVQWQTIAVDTTALPNNGYITTAGVTIALADAALGAIALVNASAETAYLKPPVSGQIKDAVLTSAANDILSIPSKAAVEIIQASTTDWYIRSNRGTLSFVSPTGYAPETLALQARLTGTYSVARKDAQNTLITGLIADNIWSLLDCFYVYTAANQVDSFLNWKSNSSNCTAVGTQTFTAFSSQTGQLSTGFIPSAASGSFTLNSASLAIWVNSASSATVKDIGVISSGTAQSYLAVNSSGRVEARMNGSAAVLGDAPGTAGLYGYTRASADSAGEFVYQNGTAINKNVAAGGNSANLPTTDIYIGGVNGDGPSGRAKRFACIGAALTGAQHLALYNRLNTFFTDIGVT